MRRGTTPNLVLTVEGLSNFDLAEVWLTLRTGREEITKTMSEMDIDGDTIVCRLSQEDTLALRGDSVAVQVRVLDESGTAEATNIEEVPLMQILRDRKITTETDGGGDDEP